MNQLPFSYTLLPSARKTIAIRITSDGRVEVRCPNRMTAAEVHRFVEAKSAWITKHLARRSNLPPFSREELELLSRQAAQQIPQRVAYFAPKIGVSWNRVTIRCQRSRWGSCSSKGNLNFNCLLMLAPPEVVDYVVVHELCHRRELNHSPAFWAEVGRILPDYPARRSWLTQHGTALIGRLPPDTHPTERRIP